MSAEENVINDSEACASDGEACASDGEDSTRIKILAIGDGECGKTCLRLVYAKNNFPEDVHNPGIKWGEYHAEIQINDKVVPIQLDEIPSNDCYYQIRTLSYENTDVGLMCFSVVDHESFKSISEKWLPEFRKYLPDVPIVLVGTKCDLRDDEAVLSELAAKSLEPISNLEALALSETIRAYEYVECSAKNADGVQDVFRAAVEAVAEM